MLGNEILNCSTVKQELSYCSLIICDENLHTVGSIWSSDKGTLFNINCLVLGVLPNTLTGKMTPCQYYSGVGLNVGFDYNNTERCWTHCEV